MPQTALRPFSSLLAVLVAASSLSACVRWASDPADPRFTGRACEVWDGLSPEEQRAYLRFATIASPFEDWRSRDCFPPVLRDRRLAEIDDPFGELIPLFGRPVLVVDPGTAWVARCLDPDAVPGERPVGNDVRIVRNRIEDIASAPVPDVLELGLSLARDGDGQPLFTLFLGTRTRSVLVTCHGDPEELIKKALAELSAPGSG